MDVCRGSVSSVFLHGSGEVSKSRVVVTLLEALGIDIPA